MIAPLVMPGRATQNPGITSARTAAPDKRPAREGARPGQAAHAPPLRGPSWPAARPTLECTGGGLRVHHTQCACEGRPGIGHWRRPEAFDREMHRPCRRPRHEYAPVRSAALGHFVADGGTRGRGSAITNPVTSLGDACLPRRLLPSSISPSTLRGFTTGASP
jgi:hypothetical protein